MSCLAIKLLWSHSQHLLWGIPRNLLWLWHTRVWENYLTNNYQAIHINSSSHIEQRCHCYLGYNSSSSSWKFQPSLVTYSSIGANIRSSIFTHNLVKFFMHTYPKRRWESFNPQVLIFWHGLFFITNKMGGIEYIHLSIR